MQRQPTRLSKLLGCRGKKGRIGMRHVGSLLLPVIPVGVSGKHIFIGVLFFYVFVCVCGV